MGREWADRIELAVDGGASALLAGAVGFAAAQAMTMPMTAALVAAAAFAGCLFALAQVRPPVSPFTLAEFACVPLEPTMPDVLVLTDADRRVPPEYRTDDTELVLDDILAELAPDSRVVRLFDPAAMPTAAELKARIDSHLDGAVRVAPDATEDLYAALDQLRHSLR